MPFANYKDFQDCVSKNKDKSNPQAYCGSIKAKTEGTAKHEQMGDNSKTVLENDQKEFEKESEEHPELPKRTIAQIVQDHKKKYGAKHLKQTLAQHWKKAKMGRVVGEYSMAAPVKTAEHSGLGQIPTDYKKNIITKKNVLAKHWKSIKAKHSSMYSHGPLLPKRARHEAQMPHMPEYALLDVQFLTEGTYRTKDIPYYYPWAVIEENAKTFEGEDFFVNHSDTNGTEMGIIDQVYTDIIEGTKWLCAKVKVPEAQFTQSLLERIENGLIKAVSSTHDFVTDPNDPSREVKKIVGKALSTVSEGEVEGAKIRSIARHIKDRS